MSVARLLAAITFLLALAAPSLARAVPLTIDGSAVGPAACPGGGVPVDRFCRVQGATAERRHCMYGGEVEFDSVDVIEDGVLCVTPFDGVDPVNTGNLVVKSLSTIFVDATSKVTGKGAGYQGVNCDDGPGFTPSGGGRGGCSVRDSGGGGAHIGIGGRGTKDCQNFGDPTSCQFPQEFEEDCGTGNAAGACAVTAGCYDNDANPTVAGQPYRHHILDVAFGSAGGDKGCLDGDGASSLRAGDGGGRIVLFAGNALETGSITIAGSIVASGARGCSAQNDSAGGGAGGTVLLVADLVSIEGTAKVSAHGGRGGDSQVKCLPCAADADCGTTGQTCQGGLCGPCNCTPCTADAQCIPELGQTCRDPDGAGALPSLCVDAAGACTPFEPGEDELECAGTQTTGVCDDCGGAGGGGIINVQSRLAQIDPLAVFDVRGGKGGICPICSGEAGGGAGELQIDSAFVGEICDGYDNDFDGTADDGLGLITCPDGTVVASCVAGVPQLCDFTDPDNVAACEVPATDARPRFALIVDTSGSMLNDLAGFPTFGDGSDDYPGVDTDADPEVDDGDDARLFIAKDALTQVLSSFPESDYALARYYQDVGVNRSCQTASNFECAASCCSYDDPRDNIAPPYPEDYPDNLCILDRIYPGASYPADPAFNANIDIGWGPDVAGNPPTTDCINYAGSCGPPRRGAQFVVGFDEPITRYLSWLDGAEDPDSAFDPSIAEGDHCPDGDCELRGTGPTPLGNSLLATRDFLTPTIACDGARDCRSYTTILLTDGAESCEGDPEAAAAELLAGVSGKTVRTYVIGFSVLDIEEQSLNDIANAGGTSAAIFVDDKEELADALAQIIGQDQRFELCNDLDDDCDELIDEEFPEKGEPCDDGELGVCFGTGVFECTDDGLGTACVIDMPGLQPGAEICNDLDDDCDGYVDEDENNQPLDCGGCVPALEICDGIDNDCDLAIDEEVDVFENQPEVFGVACGELEAPHDQAPCQLGIVRCINGDDRCVGFVGPCGAEGEPPCEVCNGADDDCDGLADNQAECPAPDQDCVEAQCVFECEGGEFPCPGGFDCRDGYCFRRDCNESGCDAGEVCVDGICRPEETGTGGGDAVGQGGAGSGPGAGSGVGGASGSGGATSATGPTVTASSASGGDDGDVFGLATGGGGIKCAMAPGSGGSAPRGAALAALALLALGARRRARGGR